MKTLEQAIEFVRELFIDHFDQGGEPYINHLLWVMNDLPAHRATHDHKIMALFHDAFEDHWDKLLELSGGLDPYEWLVAQGYLSDYAVAGLKLLTHTSDDGMTYNEYVRNIANSGNLGALFVKLSDNTHNTLPERIAKIINPEKKKSFQDMAAGRYARARAILQKAYADFIEDGHAWN